MNYIRPALAIAVVVAYVALVGCTSLFGPEGTAAIDSATRVLQDPASTTEQLADAVRVLIEQMKGAKNGANWTNLAGGGLTGIVSYLLLGYRTKLLGTPPPA